MEKYNKINYVYIYDEEKNHTYISILFPNHKDTEILYEKYTAKIIKKLETIATLLANNNGSLKIFFQTLHTNSLFLKYLDSQIKKLTSSLEFIKLNCNIVLITYKNHHIIEQEKLNLIKEFHTNNQLNLA